LTHRATNSASDCTRRTRIRLQIFAAASSSLDTSLAVSDSSDPRCPRLARAISSSLSTAMRHRSVDGSGIILPPMHQPLGTEIVLGVHVDDDLARVLERAPHRERHGHLALADARDARQLRDHAESETKKRPLTVLSSRGRTSVMPPGRTPPYSARSSSGRPERRNTGRFALATNMSRAWDRSESVSRLCAYVHHRARTHRLARGSQTQRQLREQLLRVRGARAARASECRIEEGGRSPGLPTSAPRTDRSAASASSSSGRCSACRAVTTPRDRSSSARGASTSRGSRAITRVSMPLSDPICSMLACTSSFL